MMYCKILAVALLLAASCQARPKWSDARPTWPWAPSAASGPSSSTWATPVVDDAVPVAGQVHHGHAWSAVDDDQVGSSSSQWVGHGQQRGWSAVGQPRARGASSGSGSWAGSGSVRGLQQWGGAVQQTSTGSWDTADDVNHPWAANSRFNSRVSGSVSGVNHPVNQASKNNGWAGAGHGHSWSGSEVQGQSVVNRADRWGWGQGFPHQRSRGVNQASGSFWGQSDNHGVNQAGSSWGQGQSDNHGVYQAGSSWGQGQSDNHGVNQASGSFWGQGNNHGVNQAGSSWGQGQSDNHGVNQAGSSWGQGKQSVNQDVHHSGNQEGGNHGSWGQRQGGRGSWGLGQKHQGDQQDLGVASRSGQVHKGVHPAGAVPVAAGHGPVSPVPVDSGRHHAVHVHDDNQDSGEHESVSAVGHHEPHHHWDSDEEHVLKY